jgi:hypothetical protein
MGLTAEEIKTMLGLERHPTCGFVAETYRSQLKIPTWALPEPYESNRPTRPHSTFSLRPTPRSSCTGYGPTSSTTITWATL